MYMCIYVFMYIYICVHMCTYIHVCTCACPQLRNIHVEDGLILIFKTAMQTTYIVKVTSVSLRVGPRGYLVSHN